MILGLDEVDVRILEWPEAEDLRVEEARFIVLRHLWLGFMSFGLLIGDRVLYVRLEDVRSFELTVLVISRHVHGLRLLLFAVIILHHRLVQLSVVDFFGVSFQKRHILVQILVDIILSIVLRNLAAIPRPGVRCRFGRL